CRFILSLFILFSESNASIPPFIFRKKREASGRLERPYRHWPSARGTPAGRNGQAGDASRNPCLSQLGRATSAPEATFPDGNPKPKRWGWGGPGLPVAPTPPPRCFTN